MLTPQIAGAPGVDVVKVEAVDERIDLHRHTRRGSGAEHSIHVESVRLAFEDQSAGRVADGVHVGAVDGAQQPVGHVLLVEIER